MRRSGEWWTDCGAAGGGGRDGGRAAAGAAARGNHQSQLPAGGRLGGVQGGAPAAVREARVHHAGRGGGAALLRARPRRQARRGGRPLQTTHPLLDGREQRQLGVHDTRGDGAGLALPPHRAARPQQRDGGAADQAAALPVRQPAVDHSPHHREERSAHARHAVEHARREHRRFMDARNGRGLERPVPHRGRLPLFHWQGGVQRPVS